MEEAVGRDIYGKVIVEEALAAAEGLLRGGLASSQARERSRKGGSCRLNRVDRLSIHSDARGSASEAG